MKYSLTWIVAFILFAVPALAQETENSITHGPILGRLSTDGVGVWARTAYSGRIVVEYGTDPKNLDQLSPEVETTLAADNTGWVHIKGLKANTKYYYNVILVGVSKFTGRSGSFRTMPDQKDFIDPELNPDGLFNFSFEYACGNNQNPGHSLGAQLPTFATMLREIKDDINFAILNGDWLYETQRSLTVDQWLAQVGKDATAIPSHVKAAPSIVGVWQNYKHFLARGQNLTNWHRHVPSFFTYDDHEILNDVWGAGTPGLRDRRAVFRDVGVRAWYDYLGWSNPTTFPQRVRISRATVSENGNVITDPTAEFTNVDLEQVSNLHVHWGTETDGVNENELDGVGGDPNAGVYKIEKVLGPNQIRVSPAFDADGEVSYSLGRRSYFRMRIANCDFFVCDTRGQRDMHDKSDPYKKGISMLGPVQRDWLLDGMRKSDADFLFVVSSVNFMLPHVGGGKVRANNKDDAWTVFYDEREKLINAWDKMDQPVFVLTGDLHNSFVCKITENVWEFASGPHNSNNHYYTDEGDRPANGKFKYGPREIDIRWSTHFRDDIPRDQLGSPHYCVVQINNVYNNPKQIGGTRWVAFPRPQVIFQYFDGWTGKLKYAEAVQATRD